MRLRCRSLTSRRPRTSRNDVCATLSNKVLLFQCQSGRPPGDHCRPVAAPVKDIYDSPGDGSLLSTELMLCLTRLTWSYTTLRMRLVTPSGRCSGNACQGLKDMFSANSCCLGLSKSCRGI